MKKDKKKTEKPRIKKLTLEQLMKLKGGASGPITTCSAGGCSVISK